MIAYVKDAIRKFDSDGDSKLSFDEFSRMLATKPWTDMLPEGARNTLHFARIKENRKLLAKSQKAEPSTASHFLRAAHQLFTETDLDSNGVLSRAELLHLLRKV